jgi:hypothetical protein
MTLSVPARRVGELLEIVGNHDAHVGAHIGAIVGGDPFDQRSWIRERLVAEGECQALGAGVERLQGSGRPKCNLR